MTEILNASPLVSIVMPVYNMATFLLECIPSILEQDYDNFELIIVNDGSTDQTTDAIHSFLDNRIVHVRREHDYMASMNAGIRLAKGKYIMRMDADDLMLQGRIRKQVEYMEAHPEVDVCGSGMKNFGKDDSSLYGLTGHTSVISSLLLYNTMAHPTVIMRKESVERYIVKHGTLYDKEYVYAEDYRLWTCMAMEGFRFDNIKDMLIKHRISSQAVTSVYAEESRRTAEKIKTEYLKYAIQAICQQGKMFERIIDDIMNLSGANLLNLQDIRQLIYVLYKRILK